LFPVCAALLLVSGCAARKADSSAAPQARPAAVSAPEPPVASVPRPLAAAGYKATYALEEPVPAALKAGTQSRLMIRVTNSGVATFPARPLSATGIGAVYLSYHIFSAGASGTPETAILWDGNRTPLAADLLPGASVALPLSFNTPEKAGIYDVRVDLVHEGVFWFSTQGNPALIVPIRVQ
jgi:hypothetical protein